MRPALSIDDLCKSYRNQPVLSGITFDVQAGDFFALLGPNGAGKTTLINICCSLIPKDSGNVSVFGFDLDRDRLHAKSHIGCVPQEFNFSVFEKAYDILIQQAGYYGVRPHEARHRAERYLRSLELWDHRDKPVRFLSGGMKRRLMIARALMHEPKLLFLDEPSAGVDLELRRIIWEFIQSINRSGTTIILTTHYLEEAEALCNRVAMIQHGRLLLEGRMHDILKELQREQFIVYPRHMPPSLPLFEDVTLLAHDDESLILEIERHQNISQVLSQLEHRGLSIASLKNRSSRLEETFLSLIEKTQKGDDS